MKNNIEKAFIVLQKLNNFEKDYKEIKNYINKNGFQKFYNLVLKNGDNWKNALKIN